MSSNVGLFLGFIIGCLLVNGRLCLQCYVCNEFSDLKCSNLTKTNCLSGLCSAVSVSLTAGNQTEDRIVKGCGIGPPTNHITATNSYGVRMLISKRICNSEICNEEVIASSNKVTEEEDSTASDVECYSCFSANKSKCISGLSVKCPAGLNTCYEAIGTLTVVGSVSVPVFVKQCSIPTNETNIEITSDWFNVSLNAAYCSGNLCNNVLIVPPETTTVPKTTSQFLTPNKTTTTIAPIPPKTTSGTGRSHPFSVAFILLVVVKSSFL